MGGEFNPFGGFFIVRLSYAHAWVEYFDQAAGWVRVDPTGVVSPERVTTNPDGSAMDTVWDRTAAAPALPGEICGPGPEL